MSARWRAAVPDLVNIAFVVAAGCCALAAFGASFGGDRYFVVGAAGLAIGAAVAYAGGRLRQPVLLVLAEGIAAFFVLGGAIATPSSALGGVLPSPSSLSALAHTAVGGWINLLSTSPVVGDTENLLVIPFLCGTATGLATMLLALRAAHWQLALVPPLALLGVGILFGTDATPSTILPGGVLAGVLLAWGAYRARAEMLTGIGSASRLRPLSAGVLVAGCGALGVFLGPHAPLASSHLRVVLRDHVPPPFDPRSFASPLSGFRTYRLPTPTGLEKEALFSVSGLPAGSLVRIATMDSYDGRVFGVAGGSAGSSASGNFAEVGSPVSALPCPPQAPCTEQQVSVHVLAYSDVWLPDEGIVRSITFSGTGASALQDAFRYNVATNTAVDSIGLSRGDSYTLSVDVPQVPPASRMAGASVAPVALPVPAEVPPIVHSKAATISAGASSDFARAEQLTERLSHNGAYSDGYATEPPSLPGHGAYRLAQFLALPQPVGDAEQYSAAMALMADSLGLPSRVVLGVKTTRPGSETVYGRDVTAWVEIDFAGVGWYPFFPTPPTDARLLVPPRPPPQGATSRPHQYQAPVAPLVVSPSSGANATGVTGPKHVNHPAPAAAASGVVAVVLALLLVLLILGAPLAVVRVLKVRRRSRRRRAPDTSAQISGGWAEVVDRARDLGTRLPRAATRREHARVLGAASEPVARAADRAVFGPGRPGPEEVDEFWRKVDEVLAELERGLPAWRRARARVSTTSLRREPAPSAGAPRGGVAPGSAAPPAGGAAPPWEARSGRRQAVGRS